MDLKELRRLPMPKLRDLAKAETDLQGVGGMEKEDLIKAIAKAKDIPYDVTGKDVNAIHSIKHDIRELKKHKGTLLTSSRDAKKLKKVQRKIKRLKRLTRHLAHEAKSAPAAPTAEAAPATAPAAAAAPAAPAPETPPAG
ncbi:MAG TPA: Rho termination factor N-terminal domain-containing protein [Candidatus Binatia bacterium]|jgi:hypothetical protein